MNDGEYKMDPPIYERPSSEDHQGWFCNQKKRERSLLTTHYLHMFPLLPAPEFLIHEAVLTSLSLHGCFLISGMTRIPVDLTGLSGSEEGVIHRPWATVAIAALCF